MRTFYLCFLCFLLLSCHKVIPLIPQISEVENGNISIMELKKRYTSEGTFLKITEDLSIAGIVIANDETGNFFKKIIIQDNSGGIAINIDGYDLYKEYPIGRKINITCKNLTLNDYAHTINLGLDKDESNSQLISIPAQIASTYIKKGGFEHKIEPKIVKINDLGTELHDPYQNTLVKIEGLEADRRDRDKYLGDETRRYGAAQNYTLSDCQKNTIILRTSNYSTLAKIPLPMGNGSIVGIFTPFVPNNNKQRNTTDNTTTSSENTNTTDNNTDNTNNTTGTTSSTSRNNRQRNTSRTNNKPRTQKNITLRNAKEIKLNGPLCTDNQEE